MKNSTFLNGRWIVVSGYVAMLFIITPLLPDLIKWVKSTWSGEAVKRFVLGVELALGTLLLMWAGRLFFLDRRRCAYVVLSLTVIVGTAYLFYHYVPNPYELTHLVEYAVLSMLLFSAFVKSGISRSGKGQGGDDKGANISVFKPYFLAGVVAFVVGIADELFQGALPSRRLGWRDFGLNALGCVLGLVVAWGTGNRQKSLNRRERR